LIIIVQNVQHMLTHNSIKKNIEPLHNIKWNAVFIWNEVKVTKMSGRGLTKRV